MLFRKLTCLLSTLILVACNGAEQHSSGGEAHAVIQAADIVFLGDHIITIDPDRPAAEAVAIRDDLIVLVGDRASAAAMTE